MDDFDNYVEPTAFLATLDNPPAIEELQALEGVKRVEPLDNSIYRIQFDAPRNITERMVEQSIYNGWELREIHLEKESLDEIFAQLSGKRSHK